MAGNISYVLESFHSIIYATTHKVIQWALTVD